MRFTSVLLVALLCLNSGCITAARKLEQALRRDAGDPDRPARREAVDSDDLPALAGGEVRINPGHPRLFVGREWPKARDDVAIDWQKRLRQRADETIDQPPIDYSATKLLTRSREALKRLSLYGAVYRFTGDRTYGDAGRRELMNVCGFDDWQPDNFLSTAEMMTAVSIGYDWLHDTLSAQQRKQVVSAIIRFGLRPAQEAYASQDGWTRAQHNWNLVCNGGVIVACLAVAEEEPALTKKVMAQALSSIRYGLSAYDAHGGTAEGPMYHSYATRYLTFAAAAMQSAAGDDRLLFAGHADRASYANWAAAGEYRLAMTGPLGKSANFGDSSETLGNTAWMFWHAAQFNDSDYARFQTAADRDDPSAFDLLWFDRDRRTSTRQAKRGTFKGPPYVFGSAVVLRDSVRGGKPDRLAPFLAIRTGSTDDHHSHLDLGHFVLDLQGERFAVDLGPDEYDLPGYLGSRRDDYLRSSTPGHNTLTSGNDSQPGDVEARTDMVKAENGGPAVRVNMTDAYPNARSVVRTATLDGDVATIVDDIRLSRPAKFVWHLHTPATVTPKRGGAILESNGQRVEMNVIEPKGAVLTAEPDKTRAPELPVENITHVRVSLPADTQTRVRVEFRPAAGR